MEDGFHLFHLRYLRMSLAKCGQASFMLMAMTLPVPLTLPSRQDEVFPRLTPEQIARVAAHGRTRSVVAGEVLAEGGQTMNSFFVVTEGQLDVVLLSGDKEQLVTVH